MENIFKITPCTRADIPFVADVYQKNVEALHGNLRDFETWDRLLTDEKSSYYIVRTDKPVAWFRIDFADAFELGMLQVEPKYHRQGIGRYIVSVVESIADEKGFKQVVIHTTDDNIPAQKLYSECGYSLVEIGPCTTADGKNRIGYTYQKDLQKNGKQ